MVLQTHCIIGFVRLFELQNARPPATSGYTSNKVRARTRKLAFVRVNRGHKVDDRVELSVSFLNLASSRTAALPNQIQNYPQQQRRLQYSCLLCVPAYLSVMKRTTQSLPHSYRVQQYR